MEKTVEQRVEQAVEKTVEETLGSLWTMFGTELFQINGTPVSVASLSIFLLIIVITIIASRLAQRALQRAFKYRGIEDEGTTGAVGRLVHYMVLLIGFATAIQTVGIDLGALFAAGAIFAVGLGFAMQSIVQNFVSGVILLVERSIKPGDVLYIEGMVVRVVELGIRATIVQSRDGEDLIVPNSVLIQSTVKNYTLRNNIFRVRIGVGVVYKSNMEVVRVTLEEVAAQMTEKWGVKDRLPQVIMTLFGDNSVNFEIAIWMNTPWDQRPALSELHTAVWDAFEERGIVIAFPQMDVHFDPPVHDAFAGGVPRLRAAPEPSVVNQD